MPNGQTALAKERSYYQTTRTRRTALIDDISNDETINGLARSCLTGLLTAIKSEITKAISIQKSENNTVAGKIFAPTKNAEYAKSADRISGFVVEIVGVVRSEATE